MKIKVKAVKTGKQIKTVSGKSGYFARITNRQTITTRDLAENISAISTLSTIDTVAVIEAFLMLVPEHLSRGYIVDLDGFGKFTVAAKSKLEMEESKVSIRSVTALKPIFRPSKLFKERVGKGLLKGTI